MALWRAIIETTTMNPQGLIFEFASVKAFVRNPAGDILLLRRSASSRNNAGLWDLPGGKIDREESVDDAIRREVREETGLQIDTCVFVAGQVHTYGDKSLLCIYLSASVQGATVQLSDEHSEYEWFRDWPSLEELTPALAPFASSPLPV